MRRQWGDRGQVAVELVAIVPLLACLILVLAQLAVTGYGVWSAGNAARAGARAELVGGDPERAALSAVPDWLEPGAEVRQVGLAPAGGAAPVEVALDVPALLPGAPAIPVHAAAALSGGASGG